MYFQWAVGNVLGVNGGRGSSGPIARWIHFCDVVPPFVIKPPWYVPYIYYLRCNFNFVMDLVQRRVRLYFVAPQ
ncbi:hypothetical protein E2C01_053545 [Portunus trituberculatus]|uniref:Uncharacterized protein n=1 Tax=Portunus trituberculatus TaxID=210409 RepID=A0A5B7GKL1_PORTR|nr:hypothetical protein [Portunus trituberculatus]